MSGDEYVQLLDRAFARMPKLSTEKTDFVIPPADSIVQGTKTILRNLTAIADRARRPAADIARYMSKEFAVPISVEDGRLMINGKFSAEDLNKKISKYFETYVICKECHKPDSHLESSSRGMFSFICEACGARYGIKNY
jgi:translation initiation factor 2 subunit 2